MRHTELCRLITFKFIPNDALITRVNLFRNAWRCRKFVRELLATIGVPDTAGYFAKELDLFDTTVCINTKFITKIDLREPRTPV